MLYTTILSNSPLPFHVAARFETQEQFAVNGLKPDAYDMILVQSATPLFDSLENLPPLSDKKLVLVGTSSSATNAIYYYQKIKVLVKLETMQELIKFVETIYLATESSTDAERFIYPSLIAKTKLVIKKGDEFSTLPASDAVYFFSENRIIYVVDQHGKKSMTEYDNLEALLHHMQVKEFFKANRKTVVNLTHVVKFRRVSKSKYQLHLTTPSKEPIYITPLNLTEFNHRIRSL